MKKWFFIFIGTGTYTGLVRFAPGTFGTLWGVPAAYAVSRLNPGIGGVVILASIIVAVFFAGGAEKAMGKGKDPSSIVIDEVVGFMVAAYLIPFTPLNMILAFILFRIFDILKPMPVGWLDRKLSGGWGIVLDDVAAGIYANILMQIFIYYVI